MKEKIYLIPGLMTDQRLWSRLDTYLEEFDLVHLPIPKSEHFDEIIEIIDDQIEDDKINLLGFSLGGYIASYYTLKKLDRVKKLFLLSSTPSNTEQKDIPRREKKLQEAKKSDSILLDENKALDLLEIKDDEELVQITCSMFNDLGNEYFVPQLALTLKRADLMDDLYKLNIPVKFYYSTKDRLLNHDLISKIKQIKHNFDLVSREGISHNISLEFPKDLSFEIKEWMKT
ncbi:MAG: alpha/beta fold hydrolase [Halarcobacter sp.]